MLTPMYAIISLSSLLEEVESTPKQQSMIDSILSSNILATLTNDVLYISSLKDGILELMKHLYI